MTGPLGSPGCVFRSGNPDASEWTVVGFSLEEGLNEPYVARVDVVGPVTNDPTLLLGHDATIEIQRGGFTRPVSGLVERLEHGLAGNRSDEQRVRVYVVPALTALTQVEDSRVFQDSTVPQILEKVLNAGLGPYGRAATVELDETYPKREITVQYRETTSDFLHRLMEEEGIGYRFDFSGETEQLVLTDTNKKLPTAEFADPGPVRFDSTEGLIHEAIVEFSLDLSLVSTTAVARTRDWLQPDRPIEAEEREADDQGRDREVYLHSRGIRGVEQSGRDFAPSDESRQARLVRERQGLGAETGVGSGNVTGLAAGSRFELSGHGDPALDQEYVLTWVRHSIEEGDPYVVEFRCIPMSVPWRPARLHHKPVIHGVQTATVVGPSGQEIETDAHARIRAQLHWDRQGGNNEHSMCWMRVNQTWAGSGWGFLFLPRIGMEVMVTFIDGDPDRPVVVGALYNGDNTHPYSLSDEKTKSSIKSNSSLGGEGFNEFRFEDLAGSEEIFTHAQKDQTEKVLHDHHTQVDHDQTNTVDVNQTQTVGGKQTEQVDGSQTMTVDSNRTVVVSGGSTETIDTGEERHVTSGSTETITGGETTTASGGVTETIHDGESRTVNGDQEETFNAPRMCTVNGDQNETNTGGDREERSTGPVTERTPGPSKITAPAGSTIVAEGGHTHICPEGQDHYHTLATYFGGTLRVAYTDVAVIAINRLQTFGARSSMRGIDLRYTRLKSDFVGYIGQKVVHEFGKIDNKAQTSGAAVEKPAVSSQG